MATIPFTTPIPTSESTSEDSQTNSDMDLSNINMEDEMNTDVSGWTAAEKKKLQHMTEFHEEYQWVHYLLRGEYELTNTSWSKLQHKYNVSCNTIYTVLTGKGRPGGSQYQQKRKQSVKQGVTATTSSYKAINN